MKLTKGRAFVPFFAIVQILGGGVAASETRGSWATFEICRMSHSRRECVSWNGDCSRGQDSAGGRDSKPLPCARLAAKECGALRKLVSGLVEDTRRLPAEDRSASPAGALCDGFSARFEKDVVAACFGRHEGGRELLADGFRAAMEVCDARPE